MSYFVLSGLLLSFSGLTASVGEERATFSALDYS